MARYGALAAFILSGVAQIITPNLAAESRPLPGFAVVELFTSEGCSSCPPADEALSQLAQEAARQRLPIYALEWHVDYWDYLGWKDPWDSHLATERQYAYSRALPSSVYTPQAVINGYLVPNYAGDLRELEADTKAAAAQPYQAAVSIIARQISSTSIQVSVTAAEVPRGSELLVAEVEGDLTARPDAGENAGRALVHSNVVRAAKIVPASTTEVALDVPPAARGAVRRIVVLLQNASTLRILAAAQTEVAADAKLSGRVMDPAGRPVSDVLIRACSSKLCVPGATGGDGYFELHGLLPGFYEMDFNSPAAAARVQYLRKPDGVVITKTVWRGRND